MPMDQNLRSADRRLIELRMEHADLDDAIDRLGPQTPEQEFLLHRLKKKRLQLRDQIALLEAASQPDEPA